MGSNQNELTVDWLSFVEASLNSRIEHTAEMTGKVLQSVLEISSELSDKQELKALNSLNNQESNSEDVLSVLHELMEHLDVQGELAKLIAPLFSTLQFEDRTRQKLESILAMLSIWLEARNQPISDQALSSRLMEHVVCMEQQAILAKYFPDFIQAEESGGNDIDLF